MADKPKKSKLTDRQRRFCFEYNISGNKTQAAIKAKFSKKTAASTGSRLLRNANIRKFIKKLQKETEKKAGMKAEEIVERLEKIAKNTPKAKDKIKALELLGKRFGLFPHKTEVTGEGGGPIAIQVVDFGNIKHDTK